MKITQQTHLSSFIIIVWFKILTRMAWTSCCNLLCKGRKPLRFHKRGYWLEILYLCFLKLLAFWMNCYHVLVFYQKDLLSTYFWNPIKMSLVILLDFCQRNINPLVLVLVRGTKQYELKLQWLHNMDG